MLRHGERLDRPTFHDRYVALVESGVAIKAELLEGVVYLEGDLEGDLGGDLEGAEEMVSMRRRHGSWHVLVSGLVDRYLIATPGTDGYGNTSTLTDEPSEPQPDVSLVVESDRGGQTTVDENDWVHGLPEMAIEVSISSSRHDRSVKWRVYEAGSVREYVVVDLDAGEVVLFRRRGDRFEEAEPTGDASTPQHRLETLPGFWLDNAAVLTRQTAAAWATLETGLATEEHAAFVRRLAMPRSAGWPPQRSRPPRRFARLTG